MEVTGHVILWQLYSQYPLNRGVGHFGEGKILLPLAGNQTADLLTCSLPL